MGLRRSKSKSLRTIFIKYILYLGVFLTTLMLVYYLIFGIASIGVYPANYSERIIQKNYDVTSKIIVRRGYNFNKNLQYILEVKYKENEILEDLSIIENAIL